VLLHADAGPHNVMVVDGSAYLVDFEFGAFGNALLDVVSARLGFPHSAKAAQLPAPTVGALEDAYRRAVAAAVPAAEGDEFDRQLVDACAHWSLTRWVGLWGPLVSGAVDRRQAPDGPQLAQALAVHKAFIDCDDGHRGALSATMARAVDALELRVHGLADVGMFPAFRGVTLD